MEDEDEDGFEDLEDELVVAVEREEIEDCINPGAAFSTFSNSLSIDSILKTVGWGELDGRRKKQRNVGLVIKTGLAGK